MNIVQSNNSPNKPFFYALLDEVRMLEEHSSHTPPQQVDSGSKKITLRINSSYGFQVGLDDPKSPKNIRIELDYSVEFFAADTDIQIAFYNAKHAAQFTITEWFGFDDWRELPDDCANVYFAIVYNIAKTRAENTLVALGLKAISLEKYDHSQPVEKETFTDKTNDD